MAKKRASEENQPRTGSRPRRRAGGLFARLVVLAIAGGVLWFAVQGGEYGTTDIVRLRARRASADRDVASLQRAVDSLVAWKHAIETDPTVQERIAREEFGMVRGNKEFLYRFVDTGTAGKK